MHSTNTVDQTFVREVNLSLALRLLHSQAPLSRAQLANLTGLNKSTVSSLVEELLERGLIHETGMNQSGTGRPSTLLELNPQAGCVIGVELGVDFVAVVLTNFMSNILWRKHASADPAEAQEKTLDQRGCRVDHRCVGYDVTDERHEPYGHRHILPVHRQSRCACGCCYI